MITKEQLKSEIDSLEDVQTLDTVYRLIQMVKQNSTNATTAKRHSREAQQKAMDGFFGMHKDLAIDSVEEELRLVRKGRRSLWDAL
ncbi:MAG: hypothetical protein D4R63_05990 [Methylococcaceae bacterium]|jgi:hypothetical protein|nr:MAG: hypothetical protein D4R63_05990 [Methylococcaceae bacterium]